MNDEHASFEAASDRIIREAMQAGKFDNLPGKGKPLHHDDYPFEERDLRVANRLLRDNDFAPAWIEERRAIQSELEQAQASLTRQWKWHQAQSAWANDEWQRAMRNFEERVTDLNRRIRDNILKSPPGVGQLSSINASQQIIRIKATE